ncbi:LppU/SCO3897 family protein [Streptomyces sp. NPDC001700]
MRGQSPCSSTGRTALSTNAPPPHGHSPSYPAQQPYPYGQPQYGQQPSYGHPAPPPPPRPGFFSRFSTKTKIQMIVVPLVLIGYGVWYGVMGHDTPSSSSTSPNTDSTSASAADVGDCLQNKGSESDPDLSIVDCGGATADYKVTERQVSDYECQPGNATYQMTRNGRPQFTLCMEHVSK